MRRKPTTYWDYLKLEDLLRLQSGLEKDEHELINDEVMFIVVHQIDELWFKLMIRELASVRDLFAQDFVPETSLGSAVRGLRRLALLFHKVAGHFDLMETMTTRDYLSFRDKLSPASGFQSSQLREVEILMGLDPSERVPLGHENSYLDALREADGTESPAYQRVAGRLEDKPSLRDALRGWLYRTPIQGSHPSDPDDEATVRRFIDAYVEAHKREQAAGMSLRGSSNPKDRERIEKRIEKEAESARAFLLGEDRPEPEREQAMRVRAALVFIESYRELPLLTWPREVLDSIVALEQASLIFRQRHARMVERVIGRRTGTGGSAGVDYLDQTALAYRVFRDVWAVRTLLIQKTALPPLENADAYGFVAETDTLRPPPEE